jgi:hypothetical protein
MQENSEGTTTEEEITGVEDESITCLGDDLLRELMKSRHLGRLIR